MAEFCGKMVICDRCGKSIFLKTTGEGETDGGYTRWNNFEPLPNDWGYSRDCENIARLCPTCNREYREVIQRFEQAILVMEGD